MRSLTCSLPVFCTRIRCRGLDGSPSMVRLTAALVSPFRAPMRLRHASDASRITATSALARSDQIFLPGRGSVAFGQFFWRKT